MGSSISLQNPNRLYFHAVETQNDMDDHLGVQPATEDKSALHPYGVGKWGLGYVNGSQRYGMSGRGVACPL